MDGTVCKFLLSYNYLFLSRYFVQYLLGFVSGLPLLPYPSRRANFAVAPQPHFGGLNIDDGKH